MALTLVVCVLCPYVEIALSWGQSLLDTGYDTETTVAVIALLMILAFALAKLLVSVSVNSTREGPLDESHGTLRPMLDFISTVPDASPPPLPLRI